MYRYTFRIIMRDALFDDHDIDFTQARTPANVIT